MYFDSAPAGQPRREQPDRHGGDRQPGGGQLRRDAVHLALRRQGQEHRQPRRGERRPQRQDHPRAPRGSGQAEGAADGGGGASHCGNHKRRKKKKKKMHFLK